MDRLQSMKIFVAVVDAGGFANAARRLKLSPPVVSRAVADLEKRLGMRLLRRTTRVVRATDVGARYAEDWRRILAEIEEADEAASGAHGRPRGRITVTSSVLFGQIYITPIVTEYLRRYPEVDATCLFVDRMVNLVEEGADVAIRIGELRDSTLRAIRVAHVRRVICASPEYLSAHGIPHRPEDLAGHVIVAASGVTPTPEWQFLKNGAPWSCKIHPRITTTTNESAIAAALGGFGLTRLLSYQVAQYLRSGALKTVLAEFEPAKIPVHVVHDEGRRASQKVRTFVDFAVERLRRDTSLN